jgi:hypothetical protein
MNLTSTPALFSKTYADKIAAMRQPIVREGPNTFSVECGEACVLVEKAVPGHSVMKLSVTCAALDRVSPSVGVRRAADLKMVSNLAFKIAVDHGLSI